MSDREFPIPRKPHTELKTLEDIRDYMAKIIRCMHRYVKRDGGGLNTQSGTMLINSLSKLAYVVQMLNRDDLRDLCRDLEMELVELRAEVRQSKVNARRNA